MTQSHTRSSKCILRLAALAAVLAFVPVCPLVGNETAEPASGFHSGPLLKKMLDGPMKDVEEIIFAVRVPGRDHWYVTFGNYACDYGPPKEQAYWEDSEGVLWGFAEGGSLCKLNLRTGKLTRLLEDPQGGVRDPQLHYDGEKILFSYRKGGTLAFHLYEINTDGTGLKQLTDGPDDDIEPTYVPDGGIVFCSSRCRRFVNCWYTRVATLYRCEGDGSNIRLLSSNNDHDNTPWVLPDGRILYMRWEYVDRSQVHYHHLWTMNPDGTGQMVFFGNSFGGTAMLDAKPIPGTELVVSAYSPGHGRPEHLGPVAVIDPKHGPDPQESARVISPEKNVWQGMWKDPYALDRHSFLAAHPRGIYVMDDQGNTELIYELPEDQRHFQVHEPRPVRSRPREPVIPARVDTESPTGTLVLSDVYEGRNMAGVERGTIKKLLVMKQLPKPVNFSGGMEPLTIGGSFTLAEIVGEVPVEEDGSAAMEVPALQSLFFVALDGEDKPVKRMHSFVTVQPGETLSCIGCHEQRTDAPPAARTLLASGARPKRVRPIAAVPSVFDFTRDIQPILDKHCVECHGADRREGHVDLCGDKTEMYTISYETIVHRGLVHDNRNEPKANDRPYAYGSARSRLLDFFRGSHYDAKANDHEMKMLRLWIETSACYPGTYASLGSGHYPVYSLPRDLMNERCGECHGREINDPNGNRLVLFFPHGGTFEHRGTSVNLSRPEKSRMLSAPLAKEAGGEGRCSKAVFENTNDPLYQRILAAITEAADALRAGKRFDMAGFRPNKYYIREMQRFGFLPRELGPEDPVDYYAVDRAYWDSFLHRPAQSE